MLRERKSRIVNRRDRYLAQRATTQAGKAGRPNRGGACLTWQLKCLFLPIVNNEWPSNNEVGRGCERLRDATMARDLRSVVREEADFSVALRFARVTAESCV